MSEKMDGARAYWDGEVLWSRQGKRFDVPHWFTESLPNTPLDGELWMGPGTFEILMAAINSRDSEWRNIHYYLFDLPSSPGTFKERLLQLELLQLPSHVHIVETTKCTGKEHVLSFLE